MDLKSLLFGVKQKAGVSELLTLREVCDVLKVHANTLRQWDKKGILVAVRIGEKRVRRYRLTFPLCCFDHIACWFPK